MNTCKNCSATLQANEVFCGVCGSLLVTRKENILELECERHPERPAVGLCVVCMMPVCADCEVHNNGKTLCSNPDHTLLLQDWCVVHSVDSEFEAEALARNLADGGIVAQWFSLHDHSATHWMKEHRVSVYVRTSEQEKASALLKDLNLFKLE